MHVTIKHEERQYPEERGGFFGNKVTRHAQTTHMLEVTVHFDARELDVIKKAKLDEVSIFEKPSTYEWDEVEHRRRESKHWVYVSMLLDPPTLVGEYRTPAEANAAESDLREALKKLKEVITHNDQPAERTTSFEL